MKEAFLWFVDLSLLIFVGLVITFIVISAFYVATAYPLVYKSWSTQECVKVEPESAGSCEELPDKYQIVWVR